MGRKLYDIETLYKVDILVRACVFSHHVYRMINCIPYINHIITVIVIFLPAIYSSFLHLIIIKTIRLLQ